MTLIGVNVYVSPTTNPDIFALKSVKVSSFLRWIEDETGIVYYPETLPPLSGAPKQIFPVPKVQFVHIGPGF